MRHLFRLMTCAFIAVCGLSVHAAPTIGEYVLEAGHPSLAKWLLPEQPTHPEGNAPTAERVELGKMLFFEPRLSGDGTMSCATCHNPALGWSDGLATGRGFRGQTLPRATPTVLNAAFNHLQMWDGRKRSLEDQALGPMQASAEMNTDIPRMIEWLSGNPDYRDRFARAYPGEGIAGDTIAKAIAAFERTLVSRGSRFDRWVAGDRDAMSRAEIRGFAVFLDPDKGNCAVCHSAPNFTDDGFHNLGLASSLGPEADVGRYAEKPIGLLKGAFKTPTLRSVSRTAPYFHDGSAPDLRAVVEHYVSGGVEGARVSPNMKPLDLTAREKADLVAFMHALTGEPIDVRLPELPPDGSTLATDRKTGAPDGPRTADEHDRHDELAQNTL